MAKRWYVLQVFSGYESQVKRSLEEHIRNAGLESEFGDILVPTEEVMEMRGGQQRRSLRKFFPGYVLIEMERSERDPNDPEAQQNTEADKRRWHLINNVPRVISFVGGKADNPAPIPQSQVDKILARMQEGVEQPRPKILYEPGEIVRIKDGPFVDFSGVVEGVDYEKNRLKVGVLIFGRSTSVDLEFSQIEKE